MNITFANFAPIVLNAASFLLMVVVFFILKEVRMHAKGAVQFLEKEAQKHLDAHQMALLTASAKEALGVLKVLYPDITADSLLTKAIEHTQILAQNKGLHVDFAKVNEVVAALVDATSKTTAPDATATPAA